MKTFLVCFLVLAGIGGWQGYEFYTQKVASYETALGANSAEIDTLKGQLAESARKLTASEAANLHLQHVLVDSMRTIRDFQSASASTPQAALVRTFTPPSPLPAQANWTWTTSDGKSFSDVVIEKVEADCVTIMDSDGGALVDISKLPPDIQKKLNYDPVLAATAAEKRAQDDQASAAALAQERKVAAELNQKKIAELETSTQQIRAEAQKESRAADAQGAAGQIAQIQQDMSDMVRLKNVSIDSKTGQVSGNSYWVDRYNSDASEIGRYNQVVQAAR